MHTTNEKIFARSEKGESELKHHAGCSGNAGCESGSNGNQQERTDRADSPRSDFIGDGNPVTGGILRQLIEESKNQVAAKKTEISQLESKIQDFNALLERLETNKET